MTIIHILLLVAIVQCADLAGFNTNELFGFWYDLSYAAADDAVFDEFEEKDQVSIKGCVELLEREFKRRGFKPVNLFQMMKDNPRRLAIILQSFDLEKILAMRDSLKIMEQTDLVKNFLSLVDERIMRIIPVA